MRRYVEIGEAFLLLIKEYPEERKREIKKGLENYTFTSRRKEDPPHPNSIRAKGEPEAPSDYVGAILKIMHPYYNADTANRVRTHILEKILRS